MAALLQGFNDAELAYADDEPLRAIECYKSRLDEKKLSMSSKRDCLEGISRAYIKLNKYNEALEWAKLLHSTSHLNNSDHVTVSFGLLALVYHGLGEYLHEIYCLTIIIRHHPFVQHYWCRLGDAYLCLPSNQPLPFSARHRTQVVSFCFIRAVVLLQTVQRTVKGFIEERHEFLRDQLKQKLEELKIKPEVADRIQRFASLDIFNRHQPKEQSSSNEKTDEEFQDLGKSQRLKKIEATFEQADGAKFFEFGYGYVEDKVAEFEIEWFLFLEE